MLDDVVARIDPDPAAEARAPEIRTPEIKVQRDDAITGSFGLVGKTIPGAERSSAPLGSAAPDIKIEPVDAPARQKAPKAIEKAPVREKPSFFASLWRFTTRAAAVACLCGLAWAGGVYSSRGHAPTSVANAGPTPAAQPSAPNEDIASAVRQMADDMRALKTRLDANNAVASTTPQGPAAATQTAPNTAVADLAGRVDKLDTELTAKLAQINEQLTGLEQKIQTPAQRTTVAAQTPPAPRKHKPHLHDAFDPTKDPYAPGVPHPLGFR